MGVQWHKGWSRERAWTLHSCCREALDALPAAAPNGSITWEVPGTMQGDAALET